MNPWDSQSARVYSQEGAWHGLSSNSNGGQSRDAVLCVCPLEGNGTRDSHRGDGYGKEGDPCFTLNSVEQHAVAFGISPYWSEGMLSDNPKVGFYETDTTRTLDLNGGSPACQQDGITIVEQRIAVDVYNQTIDGEVGASLTAAVGMPNTSGPKVMEIYAIDMGAGKSTSGIHKEVSPTLATTHYGEPVINDTRGFGETGQGYWQSGIQALRAEGENRPSRPSNVIVKSEEKIR